MQGLLGYTVRRLLWVPVILFAVSFFAFSITRFGPGDYVDVLAGPPATDAAKDRRRATTGHATDEAKDRLRHETGLDKPFYEQYAIYMKDAATGDFGESFTIYRGRGVWEIIWPRMLVSMQPGLVALVMPFPLGTAVGIFAALRQGTWLDPLSISTFLFFQSIPVLVSLPFLVLIFVVKLGWVPAP